MSINRKEDSIEKSILKNIYTESRLQLSELRKMIIDGHSKNKNSSLNNFEYSFHGMRGEMVASIFLPEQLGVLLSIIDAELNSSGLNIPTTLKTIVAMSQLIHDYLRHNMDKKTEDLCRYYLKIIYLLTVEILKQINEFITLQVNDATKKEELTVSNTKKLVEIHHKIIEYFNEANINLTNTFLLSKISNQISDYMNSIEITDNKKYINKNLKNEYLTLEDINKMLSESLTIFVEKVRSNFSMRNTSIDKKIILLLKDMNSISYKPKVKLLLIMDFVQQIDKLMKSSIDNEKNQNIIKSYKEYRDILKTLFFPVIYGISKMIKHEIDHTEEHLSSSHEQDEQYINELQRIRMVLRPYIGKNSKSFSQSSLFSSNIDSPIPLHDLMDIAEKQITLFINLKEAKKYRHFLDKKVSPYKENLNLKENMQSEATRDLQIILNEMINDTLNKTKIVSCKLNVFDEIEVQIGNKKYNLTQILQHEPDIQSLNLTENQLNIYLKYLQQQSKDKNHKGIMKVINSNKKGHSFFEMNKNWCGQNSKEIKKELSRYLKENNKKNKFQNCHAASCIAIFLYSKECYIPINKLMRDGKIPRDLFKIDKSAPENELAVLENNLRGKCTHAPLNYNEMNQVILETTMAALVCANGMKNAEHIIYDPFEPFYITNDQFSLENARTVRGTSGNQWVIDLKNQFEMAYISGQPVYMGGFISSSLIPKKTNKFVKKNEEPLKTKIVSYFPDESNLACAAVDISGISKHNENEYLYPPGCLILSKPESPMLHPRHYDDTTTDTFEHMHTEKVVNVITNGKSIRSFYYSTEVNNVRNEMIEYYEKYAEDDDILKDGLHKLIKAFESQLRKIDLVMMNQEPTLQNIANLRKKGDAAFIVTQDKIFYFDKMANTLKELPIDDIKLDNIKKLFNLSDKFSKLGHSLNTLTANTLNLLQIKYLQKMTDLENLNISYEPRELLELYADDIKQIRQSVQYIECKKESTPLPSSPSMRMGTDKS